MNIFGQEKKLCKQCTYVHRGEDERVAGDLDVKLAMLLSSEALFNGDSICLEYEEEAES